MRGMVVGLEIFISEVVRKTGARSDSKVQQMKRALRNGGRFPAIRVALIDETLRKRLGRMGLSTVGKKYFLLEGHHRFCVTEAENVKTIAAKVVRKLY